MNQFLTISFFFIFFSSIFAIPDFENIEKQSYERKLNQVTAAQSIGHTFTKAVDELEEITKNLERLKTTNIENFNLLIDKIIKKHKLPPRKRGRNEKEEEKLWKKMV